MHDSNASRCCGHTNNSIYVFKSHCYTSSLCSCRKAHSCRSVFLVTGDNDFYYMGCEQKKKRSHINLYSHNIRCVFVYVMWLIEQIRLSNIGRQKFRQIRQRLGNDYAFCAFIYDQPLKWNAVESNDPTDG